MSDVAIWLHIFSPHAHTHTISPHGIRVKRVTPGDNVGVPISKFDRSFGDLPNVIGVVLARHEKQLYTIGTKSGKIKENITY